MGAIGVAVFLALAILILLAVDRFV